MKRVLQIVAGLNRGGLESFIMNIYREIDRSKIQFDFLVSQEHGAYDDEIISMGGVIYRIPARNNGYFVYQKALDSFFKEHASNYIACHQHVSSLSSIDALKYASFYGIPIRVIHSHNSTISKHLHFRLFHLLLHYKNKPNVKKWATHYLGCSDKAIDWMYKYTGVYSKALMCNNGIDVELYKYSTVFRESIRNEFSISQDELVLGHVGRFEPVKNQSFLIEILEFLIQHGISARLILVGTGPLMNQMREFVENKQIGDRVIFTGVRSDVYRLLQAMDIFVMPSLFEGLPLTLVEAQAAGLPVLASDSISANSDITGTICFKSLKDGADNWGRKIIEMGDINQRQDNIEKIKKAGFDSHSTVKQLVEIYTSNV